MPVIAVVGPTATGKSDLAIALATRLGSEVVNADAMQLYRGMDIGTAKLPPAQWGGVPHHVFDLWNVTEAASVVEYRDAARHVIETLLAADRIPVVVGGSGLYVRAALDHLDFPGTNPQLRAALEQELAEVGAGALHAKLAECDPVAADAILPSNGRRIIRALEVIELTGRPFVATLPEPTPAYPTVYLGVDRATEQLDARVDRRVDAMWQAGLVAEARNLVQRGLRKGPTASRALGYAQILRMFDGELTEADAIAQTKQATRRFVRRQRSWFRRENRIHWLDAGANDLIEQAVAVVVAEFRYPA